MKKYEIVRSNILFNEIINHGHKISNDNYSIFYLHKLDVKPNFGIAVSKKLGNAVMRNKIKRQLRNIITNNKFLFKNNNNYIIMVKKSFINLKYNEKENSLKDLLRKVQDEKK